MAVKTITIDTDAYDILAREKRAGQSFSMVIKEHFGKRKTAAALLRALPSLPLLEEDTLDRIEELIKDRRKHPARIPRL